MRNNSLSTESNLWSTASALTTIANQNKGLTAIILSGGNYQLFNPKTGYFVSFTNNRTSLKEFNSGDNSLLISELKQARGRHDYLLGIWIDEGRVYVDRSQWYTDLDVAKKKGKSQGQKAIWDCANNKEITL